jgi:hypothetical protein
MEKPFRFTFGTNNMEMITYMTVATALSLELTLWFDLVYSAISLELKPCMQMKITSQYILMFL